MKEVKLNEIFEHKGVTLQCVKEHPNRICAGCYFEGCLNRCNELVCLGEDRYDEHNVIFIKVNQNENMQ